MTVKVVAQDPFTGSYLVYNKSMKKLLIVGDPRGNHTLAALKKYPAESITVWEHPDNHYTIHQLCDNINVTDDLDKLNGMRFDVVIGNPPYTDTSSVVSA